MTLMTYLQGELAGLMKRRDRLALNAVRDAISAIQNAETTYIAEPARIGATNEFVAGAVRFGQAERVVADLDDAEMMALARAQVTRRIEEAVQYRDLGDVDKALTLKAEALALADRLDAYPA